MTEPPGLELFGARLSASFVTEVRRWRGHPELSRLLARLEATSDEESFFNTCAEAAMARHLVSQGCAVRFEVPTPSGRTADFEVVFESQCFYLHVKRVSTDRPVQRRLAISSRLRSLERIRRPYVVNIRWNDGLTDRQMQRFVEAAAEFIGRARVGDEMIVNDETHEHHELGGCSVVAPWEGDHVTLAIGLPAGYVGEAPRMLKLLHRAHRQFMPRAINVILLASSHPDDVDDFETALLGSHIERWDAVPPPGRRIAHGRAADGFWSEGHFQDSAAVGWFLFEPSQEELRSRLFLRDEPFVAEPTRSLLLRLLDGPKKQDGPDASRRG